MVSFKSEQFGEESEDYSKKLNDHEESKEPLSKSFEPDVEETPLSMELYIRCSQFSNDDRQ